jgi:hypothetical protein
MMKTERESSSPKKTQLCPLESLTTDVLIAVMARTHSSADLSAFIHASPLLYASFLEGKFTILLGLVSRNLGPALRDAIILSRTPKLVWELRDPKDDVAQLAFIDNHMQQYQHLLNKPVSMVGIDLDTLIDVVHCNRDIQYFVDWFHTMKFSYFRRMDPDCIRPWSINERHRISQAIVRRQILLHLRGVQEIQPYRADRITEKLLWPFKPWEMEQISEINAFMADLCKALANLARVKSRWYQNEEKSYFAQYYNNLLGLRQRMLSEGSEVNDLFKFKDTQEVRVEDSNNHNYADFLCGSHIRRVREAHLELYHEPVVLETMSFMDDRVANPPFAWLDARDSRSGKRWGTTLLFPIPAQCPDRRWARASEKFQVWRWLGFVFWDRDRVELFKNTAKLSTYQTGWLTRIWDLNTPLGPRSRTPSIPIGLGPESDSEE